MSIINKILCVIHVVRQGVFHSFLTWLSSVPTWLTPAIYVEDPCNISKNIYCNLKGELQGTQMEN
jgi:hypothetical protein